MSKCSSIFIANHLQYFDDKKPASGGLAKGYFISSIWRARFMERVSRRW
jgi:hypothetical protein